LRAARLPNGALGIPAGGIRRKHEEEHRMDTRRLGRTGPTVSALSLGLMGMSDLYGLADEAESVSTIHAALEGSP
jgi:hypothetical protein